MNNLYIVIRHRVTIKGTSLRIYIIGLLKYQFFFIFLIMLFQWLLNENSSQCRARLLRCLDFCHRGISCDVITSRYCKSLYLWLPCWFPLRTWQYWKYFNMSNYFFLFSSYQITKLQPSDKNKSKYTRLKFQILSWANRKY